MERAGFIVKLDDLVYTGSSEIHGTGLFARHQISQGDYIGTYEGSTTTTDGTYVLWLYEEGKTPVGRCGENLLRYLNHAEDANAAFDGFALYALTTIEPDEEITFNYEGETRQFGQDP